MLWSRLVIFEFDLFFYRRDFMSGFKPKLCRVQRDRFLLLKTTSVELEGRAGQHGVCVLAWGAMEVLTSWSCHGRVGSKRTDGDRMLVKLRWNSNAALVLLWEEKILSVCEEWAARVVCLAQGGIGCGWIPQRDVAAAEWGDGVNHCKDVVWS